MANYVIRIARSATIVALFAVAALLGILSGVLFAFAGDLPEISALDNYNPSTITRVYAANGDVIGEFAVQRRLVIGYDDISPRLREAIISAEDADFNSHFGLSISRILITLMRDVFEHRLGNPAGASTLTQQLARNLFPIGFEKSIDRKVKEALLAIQIEKRYTKREILTLYCNQIHFGHGTNGVEAAARLYFNKRAKDLTLEEAALIAGIIQSPARQSPYVDMAAATRRRNYVLQRMAEEHYITADEAETARATPIALKGQPQPENPYRAIIGWFDKGNSLNVFFNTKDSDKLRLLYKVDGLHAFVKKYFKHANDLEAALLMEFVLHGLSAYSLISKKIVEGKIEFKDLMGSMLNISSTQEQDEEFDGDFN